MDGYKGKALTGKGSSHKECNLVYYDLDNVKDGTNDTSRMKIRKNYYNDDQLKEIDAILGTLKVLVE